MRRPEERLRDILDAVAAIEAYLARGTLSDAMVLDAVRMRLVEIGEAVKALPPDLLAAEPDIPWRDVAGARDWLAHHYFDTARGILQATVDNDLPPLAGAVRRLLARWTP